MAVRAPRTIPPLVDADWSRGMIRDAPRAALPPGAVYDAADYMLHEPGLAYKRGGYGYYGYPCAGATGLVGVCYAPFSHGARVVAVGDNGHLFDVAATLDAVNAHDIGDLGSDFHLLGDVPKLVQDKLVITSSNGASPPQKVEWSGTTMTVAALGGSPSDSAFSALYKSYLVTAGGNRVQFSPPLDIEATWDTGTDGSWIDCDYQITGLAALQNALIVFSDGHFERIIGSKPPPDSDMDRGVIASVGCLDARSIAYYQDSVIFANPRGVYMTNGAAPISLTGQGLISRYWQGLFAGQVPTSSRIIGGIFRDFYTVNVFTSDGVVSTRTTLMCNVPRRGSWRITNLSVRMLSEAVGAAEELYAADTTTNRVLTLSGWFNPSSTNKADANGTAVQPLLETKALGQGVGLKHFGYGRLTYDMAGAGDDPELAVYVAEGVEAPTFVEVGESPLLQTTGAERHRFSVRRYAQTATVRLVQTNPSAKTELYALEIEQPGLPSTAGGV